MMNKIACAFYFLFLLLPCCVHAQIFPTEDKELNYRIIGFRFPAIAGVSKYKIQIAAGYYNNADSFRKNTVATYESKENKVIGEVPAWGKPYTWCIVNKSGKPELHHFQTTYDSEVDTSLIRLRILKNAVRHKDAYVLLDGLNVIYDMKGSPVWVLPGFTRTTTDIKLSPQHTITLLVDQPDAREVDYNGHVLYELQKVDSTADKDRLQHYHHEFTRLANGHYMVLSNEMVYWKNRAAGDTIALNKSDTQRLYTALEFGTLLEYDTHQKIVWKWKSSDYFLQSDVFKNRSDQESTDPHENAFYFDEQKKAIYVSFKNISRVVKISYPDGRVLAAYGDQYDTMNTGNLMANSLFCGQHSCKISDEGYIYLFNNNTCNQDMPTVVIMQQPEHANMPLKKVWEYKCPACDVERTNAVRKLRRPIYGKGGNVTELDDKSMFVATNGNCKQLFIVNRDHELLWQAAAERRKSNEDAWNDLGQLYRASIIKNRAELEQLIWNSTGAE